MGRQGGKRPKGKNGWTETSAPDPGFHGASGCAEYLYCEGVLKIIFGKKSF
jgi:hypothetical protein